MLCCVVMDVTSPAVESSLYAVPLAPGKAMSRPRVMEVRQIHFFHHRVGLNCSLLQCVLVSQSCFFTAGVHCLC